MQYPEGGVESEFSLEDGDNPLDSEASFGVEVDGRSSLSPAP